MKTAPFGLTSLVLALSLSTTPFAQPKTGRTHRLEATPQTVAYGYYDAAAKPVLRIASGDILDVDTLLTNVPDRLERAGVPPHKKMTLAWPRAETPAAYISMGTDEDLTKATRIAIQETIDFLAATKGLDRHEAYQLTSIAGDVAITQLVDTKVGVHVKMPKAIFRKK